MTDAEKKQAEEEFLRDRKAATGRTTTRADLTPEQQRYLDKFIAVLHKRMPGMDGLMTRAQEEAMAIDGILAGWRLPPEEREEGATHDAPCPHRLRPRGVKT